MLSFSSTKHITKILDVEVHHPPNFLKSDYFEHSTLITGIELKANFEVGVFETLIIFIEKVL